MTEHITTHRETYRVTGMTCDHCVRAVSTEVGAIDGVTDVRADLATGEVTVDSTGPVPLSRVKAAVDEAGYVLAG